MKTFGLLTLAFVLILLVSLAGAHAGRRKAMPLPRIIEKSAQAA